MERVLFLCNQGRNRSRTAADLFAHVFETRSAGLFSVVPVSVQEVNWADTIIVMEEHQRAELMKRFPLECLRKRVLCFNVSDVFCYNDSALKEIIVDKMAEVMPVLATS